MAELYGRATGCCKDKGGSMHVADASVGYLGANRVLTSGCVLAPGVGQSIQMRGTDQVAVTVFGAGAANRGPFHEGVNLAALWKAPVVFVCVAGPNIPIPFSPPLEAFATPGAADLVDAVRRIVK